MKKKIAGLLALSLAAMSVLTACGGGGSASSGGDLTLGTGSTTGTYYAVGGVMASVLSPKIDGASLTVTSTGASMANIQLIEDGEADLAIVQNDVMSYAASGTDLFEGQDPYVEFRAVAGLYDETCQIVATSNIKSVEDLKGKTVSVGDAGSGTEFNARQILAAYGISFDDINVVNLGFTETADSIKDGKIDAGFVTAGAPTTAVTDLSTTVDINIVPVDAAHADQLIAEHPFYTKVTIPGGTYSKITEDVDTVAVRATLIADKDISEDTIYALTKALFESQDELVKSHDKFKELSLDNAKSGIDTEFHPGALKYFEEKGLK